MGIDGLVAGKVNEIDGARAGEEVGSGKEDEKRRAESDGDEVVAEMLPNIDEIFGRESGQLGGDGDQDGHEHEEHSVGYEIVVPELHVLEFDGLFEVGEALSGGSHGNGIRRLCLKRRGKLESVNGKIEDREEK